MFMDNFKTESMYIVSNVEHAKWLLSVRQFLVGSSNNYCYSKCMLLYSNKVYNIIILYIVQVCTYVLMCVFYCCV